MRDRRPLPRDPEGRVLEQAPTTLASSVSPRLQRALGNLELARGVAASEPRDDLAGDPGQPLAAEARTALGRHLPPGSEQVRIHTGSDADEATRALGARAFTLGSDLFFARGQYRPRSLSGRALLLHELTHARQQRDARHEAHDRHDDGPPERGAQEAAGAYLLGRIGPTAIPQAHSGATLQTSRLSDQVEALWGTNPDKGRIFDLLRSAPQPEARDDLELRDCLARIFAEGTDDLWLAQTIQRYGPGPFWPTGNQWVREAGNAEWENPVTGGEPVRAYYFRGQTDRRAMIVSGVHGSEVSGVEVVEQILTDLRRPGAVPPYFSVIIVPRLFPERVAAELATARRPSANSNDFRESGVTEGGREVPTNRNFPRPRPGATPEEARRELAAATRDAQARPQTILAQNRILLDLINRFQPERIASVHGNRRTAVGSRGGPGSGVFVDPAYPTRSATAADPRVKDSNANRDHPATAEDRLTANLARRVAEGGGRVPGNFVNPTAGARSSWAVGQTRYDPAGTLHNDGVSLGGLAQPLGMTVITVEVPGYAQSARFPAGTERDARLREIQAYATSLEEIFLGPDDEAASARP